LAPLKTLGIDLAAQDLKTAACLLDWSMGKATVEVLLDRQSNGELKELAAARQHEPDCLSLGCGRIRRANDPSAAPPR